MLILVILKVMYLTNIMIYDIMTSKAKIDRKNMGKKIKNTERLQCNSLHHLYLYK